MPYMTSNGTLHLRTRRHAPSTDTHQQAIAVQQFPLSEAVHKMETQEPIYVGPIVKSMPLVRRGLTLLILLVMRHTK